MPKVTNHLNLGQKQLQNALIHKLASAPGTPVAGQIYYNTGDNSTYVYNGTAWEKLNNVVMSDSDILEAVKRVDGAGSGLDADLLDNNSSAHYLDRANHTNTQPASTISDLATVVKGYRLDEFAAPTASVSLNNQKITNLANPLNPQEAATKAYVDAVAQGLDPKESVKVIATSNVSSLSGEQTVNGVSLNVGSRILLTAQTSTSQNRIYVVNAGAWTVAPDSDPNAVPSTLSKGAYTFSEANGDGYVYLGNDLWDKFNKLTTVSAGTGISVSTSGTTSTVSLNTDLGSNVYVAKAMSFVIGDGTATTFTLTTFGGDSKVVSVRENTSGGEYVLADIVHTNAVTTTVTFADAPTTNQYRVTIVGF